MSQAEVLVDVVPAGSVVSVPVAGLGACLSFRVGGLCAEQVETLVGLGGAWPPILVGRVDGRVIDGAHRVEAARRLGLVRVEAELFEGSAAEGFVEFVRRNVAHGLTLTLVERKRAAVRVLGEHPGWSDRRVAELCALSPKTVGRLRGEAGCPTAEGPHSDGEVREGRDLRVRPVRRGPVRARVVDALRAQPTASLRTIAAGVGVSPETVRLVRLNLAEDAEVVAPVPVEVPVPEPGLWREDAALASVERAEDFLGWFERTAVSDGDLAWVDSVPLSRVYVIAEEARHRSETWQALARALESRPKRNR